METVRFLENFDVILLDQGRTFMFENDRFGADVDYFETYVGLGGRGLSPDELRTIVERLYSHMFTLSRSPGRYDSFPSVYAALRELDPGPVVGLDDAERLAELFAIHELGTIPEHHSAAIHALSGSHRLGILSNIWGPKERFEENLRRAGVIDCFEVRVWSSDYGVIKPSARIFRKALELFGVEASRALMVGDHPMRDVDAAKAIGCGAVWINNDGSEFPEGLRAPDVTIRHLDELTVGSGAGINDS